MRVTTNSEILRMRGHCPLAKVCWFDNNSNLILEIVVIHANIIGK